MILTGHGGIIPQMKMINSKPVLLYLIGLLFETIGINLAIMGSDLGTVLMGVGFGLILLGALVDSRKHK